MEPIQGLTSEDAQKRLLLAYREGNGGSFAEFARRPLLNPIEQRDERNKRKVHPLLVVAMLLIAVAVVATFYFSR